MKKLLLVILAIVICIAVYIGVVGMYKNNKEQEVKENKNQQQEEIISNDNLYELKEYPKIDGSTATLPLAEAFKANFTKSEEVEVTHSKTHNAYVKLINDEVDLILVTEPSEDELELAKQKGVELEVIPVVKEGFVFYVNSENEVDNLTTEQIQKYTQVKLLTGKMLVELTKEL